MKLIIALLTFAIGFPIAIAAGFAASKLPYGTAAGLGILAVAIDIGIIIILETT